MKIEVVHSQELKQKHEDSWILNVDGYWWPKFNKAKDEIRLSTNCCI